MGICINIIYYIFETCFLLYINNFFFNYHILQIVLFSQFIFSHNSTLLQNWQIEVWSSWCVFLKVNFFWKIYNFCKSPWVFGGCVGVVVCKTWYYNKKLIKDYQGNFIFIKINLDRYCEKISSLHSEKTEKFYKKNCI